MEIKYYQKNRLTGQDLHGYPIVQSYKFLGTHIQSNHSLKKHKEMVERKVEFLTTHLYQCLKCFTPSLRRNLWRLLVLPLYTSAASIYMTLSKTEQKLYLKSIEGSFKRFLLLKKTTHNQIVKQLLNMDVAGILEAQHSNSQAKSILRQANEYPSAPSNKTKPQSQLNVNYEDLPVSAINLFNIINSKTCIQHKGRRLTIRHLSQEHGISIDISNILDPQTDWHKLLKDTQNLTE